MPSETAVNHKVRDLGLAAEGRLKIDWAESRMPVMMELRRRFSETKPLAGTRIAGCLHVTKETAVLMRTLVAAGARISWSGCNPLSTQDDVAAALADEGIEIYAWHGMNKEEFYWCIDRTIDMGPTMTLDDGADLIFTIHKRFAERAADVWGGTEETTTGVHRLRAMAEASKLFLSIMIGFLGAIIVLALPLGPSGGPLTGIGEALVAQQNNPPAFAESRR